MTRKIDHAEVVRMLAAAAANHGLTLERFYRLGLSDDLDSPTLRDLWLIWGDELSETDVKDPVTAA